VNLSHDILSSRLREEIADFPHRKVGAGESLILYRPASPSVFWVRTGIFKVGSFTSAGQEDLRYLVKEGSLFGELAIMDKVEPEDFAVAITDAEICEISLSQLNLILQKEPRLRIGIMNLMRERLDLTEKRLQSLIFKASGDRVLAFLEEYIREFGKLTEDKLTLPNYLSHSDIALFTSTSRQTVNRIFNQLKKEGVLNYDKQYLWTQKDNFERFFISIK